MPDEKNNGMGNPVPAVNNTVNSNGEQNPNVDSTSNVSPATVANSNPTVEPVKVAPTVPVQDSVQNVQATGSGNNVNNVTPNPMPNNVQSTPGIGTPASDSPSNKGKKKNNLVPIILVVVAIVAIAAAAFLLLMPKKKDPEKVLKGAINDVYESFSKGLKTMKGENVEVNPLTDPIKVSGNLTVGGDLFKDIVNDKLSFNIGFDYAKKQMDAALLLNENNSDLVDATIFVKNNKAYIKSNSLFDNTYFVQDFNWDEEFDFSELEASFSSSSQSLSIDDMDHVVKTLVDAINNSIDEKYISSSNETIKINNDSVKTYKITYKVNKESLEAFAKSFINSIKNDEKLLKILADNSDVSVEDLKKQLEESVEQVAVEDFSEMQLNVYTVGNDNEVVKFEVVDTKDSKNVISYADYKDNAYLLVNLTEEGQTIKLEVISTKKNNVQNVDVKFMDKKYATFTVRAWNEKEVDLDYDINVQEAQVSSKGTIKITAEAKDATEKFSISFSTDSSIAGQTYKFSIKADMDVKFKEELTNFDVSKALTMEQMTEADATKMTNAMEKLQKSNIYKFIEKNGDKITNPTPELNMSGTITGPSI